MAKVDITDKIEIMATLEERMNITLSGLSAFIDHDDIEDMFIMIYGDVTTRDGQALPHNIKLIAAVYDTTDRIIGKSDYSLFEEDFFCMETFQMMINIPLNSISKIRIYPNKN